MLSNIFYVYTYVFSILDAAILSADPSKVRPYHQDYRVYLIRLAQSGLFGQIEMTAIHKFADLYEAARHEPGVSFFFSLSYNFNMS